MRFISPEVVLIEEKHPLKIIELAGRTCYKSDSEMTEETAEKFFKNLNDRKHFAIFEHATFVFEVDEAVYKSIKCSSEYGKFFNLTETKLDKGTRYLISGNARAVMESKHTALLYCMEKNYPIISNSCPDFLEFKEKFKKSTEIKDEDNFFQSLNKVVMSLAIETVKDDIDLVHDLKDLPGLTKEEFMAHAHFTFKFTCDRGVSHEIVRHRMASYAQESTRYCNYAQDKHGEELSFIVPSTYSSWKEDVRRDFTKLMENCERTYLDMIKSGGTPEQARAVLPNALKTELIMTANAQELHHFFNLRHLGTTGKPHPDMEFLAGQAYDLYKKKKTELLG